ncbi:glycosyltransferase [Phragmitibacter flavus]|uniref:Glycosyltransferase n=1 Tax=Phragmitibacter flavus TaxID=2576071 RepID=A0A5R8KA61_9BACT|nr:glycosyltransferase [Phragmitibacter flavus]TLD68419.1 glycosyltransferase [Phragmitibacter flavus]
MVVVSHPVGNANVRAVLDAFQRAGCLHEFYTTVAADSERGGSYLPKRLAAQMRRRTFPVPATKIRQRPWLELMRLSIGRHGFGTANEWVTRVCKDLDRHVAGSLRVEESGKVDVAYAYEDCASQTFAVAKQRGWKCVYDLPIAYWGLSQRLMREELQRWPDWAPTMQGVHDSGEKLERKDAELRLSDVVVCCSRFVLDSLPEWARQGKRCVVAEFGSDQDAAGGERAENENEDENERRPLRVLFAGSMTQRKGLADLFEAAKLLGRDKVELVVLGQPVAPLSFYQQQCPQFRHEPTRSRQGVLELMRNCDVFVLPSLVEGRALVQQEALSCGLPLIITPNTGGEDLIDEGETGFVVPIRAPEKIAERLEWFCRHRHELKGMREAARRKAALYTWQEYGRKVLEATMGTD